MARWSEDPGGEWKSARCGGQMLWPAGQSPAGPGRIGHGAPGGALAPAGQPLEGSVSVARRLRRGSPGGGRRVRVDGPGMPGVPAPRSSNRCTCRRYQRLTTQPSLALRLSTSALISEVPVNCGCGRSRPHQRRRAAAARPSSEGMSIPRVRLPPRQRSIPAAHAASERRSSSLP